MTIVIVTMIVTAVVKTTNTNITKISPKSGGDFLFAETRICIKYCETMRKSAKKWRFYAKKQVLCRYYALHSTCIVLTKKSGVAYKTLKM